MRDINMPITIDDIVIGSGRREVDPAVVKRLSASIESIGLRHPITVRKKGEQYILIAGRHRIEAFRKLDREHIPACIVSMTNAEARMWEIAENLHRAELTKLQRAEQIEEWRKLAAQIPHQGQHGGHNSRGQSETAEALGVDRRDVRAAEKIAVMTPEAKEAAHEAGIDDNQSKLLAVAKEPAERQVAKVAEVSQRERIDGDVKARAAREIAEMLAEYVPGAAWDALKSNLYASGAANIAIALTNITGQSLMDKRFG